MLTIRYRKTPAVPHFVYLPISEPPAALRRAKPHTPPPTSPPKSRWAPLATRACDITPPPPLWAWWPFFPKGDVGLLEGASDVGKSFLACDLIARWVDLHRRMPGDDGRRAQSIRGGAALYLLSEGTKEGIVRRLQYSGADLGRVHVLHTADLGRGGLPRYLSEPDARAELEVLISDLGIGFVVLDALKGVLGVSNEKDGRKVRAGMEALQNVAVRTNSAFVGIRHHAQDPNASLLVRGSGLDEWQQVPRGTVAVVPDPDDDKARIVIPVIHNEAKDSEVRSLRFRFRDDAALVWDDRPLPITARTFQPDADNGKPKRRSQKDRAKDAVLAFLLASPDDTAPTEAMDIALQGPPFGLSTATVRAARTALRNDGLIDCDRPEGHQGPVWWRLLSTKE